MIRLILENKFEQQILSKPEKERDSILHSLNLTMQYDPTVPAEIIFNIGSRSTKEKALQVWIQKIAESISRAFSNNVSEGMKYVPYLFNQYIGQHANWEELTGELIDNVKKWWLLKNRGVMDPQFQDLNRLSPAVLQMIIQREKYQNVLRILQNEEVIRKAKKERKQIVLIDNDRYQVSIPLNYGACYVFNNAEGVQANFCTGGSSGLTWFKRYAPDGIMLMVTDKQNVEKTDGKWQIHAATNQIVNSQQESRYDSDGNSKKFASLFPGLMNEIVKAMKAKQEEIEANSLATMDNKYDVDAEIKNLQEKFPGAFHAFVKENQ